MLEPNFSTNRKQNLGLYSKSKKRRESSTCGSCLSTIFLFLSSFPGVSAFLTRNKYLWQMGFTELLPSHENNPPQRKYVFCGVELRLIASNTLRLPAVESSSDQTMFP